jgi:polyhydroxybutyrate depolymerase
MNRPLLALALIALAPLNAWPHSTVSVDAGRGPVTVYVPDSYVAGTALPLLFLLHGYGSNGAQIEAYTSFLPHVDTRGFLYATPNGTVDTSGARFWNATNACCNFFGSTVDDSTYLFDLIELVEAALSVDPKRIYVTGHSNGGFMSYRMACDHADKVAAIASLAGASWLNPAQCTPAEPVHVLQMHGTADPTISYGGGTLNAPYPGAVASTEQWAGFAGCAISGTTTPAAQNIVLGQAFETDVTTYATGCSAGGSGELWTINGAGHNPNLNAKFAPAVLDWLFQHPKNEAPVAYCTSGTSSNGCRASLAGAGIASLSRATGFQVTATAAEGGKGGLFYYGQTGAQAATWGNGTSYLCVLPPVQRTGLMVGSGTPGACDGGFVRDFAAFWSAASPGALPTPGARIWIQLWYRDPLNTSNRTTGLSNALDVLVCP